MPNGHAGVPYCGGPVFFAMVFAFFVWLPLGEEGWVAWVRFGICMALAAVIGWRIIMLLGSLAPNLSFKIFAYIRRVDRWFLWLNVVFLLALTAIYLIAGYARFSRRDL